MSWNFFESLFNNRANKSRQENGEYYLSKLYEAYKAQWPNEKTGIVSQYTLEMRLINTSHINAVEDLGWYCELVNFDEEIIEAAFAEAVKKRNEITLAEINFRLTGKSIPSQTSEKVEKVLVDGLQTAEKVAGTVIDTGKTVLDNAVDFSKETFSNLRSIMNQIPYLFPLVIGVLVFGLLYWLIAQFKKVT